MRNHSGEHFYTLVAVHIIFIVLLCTACGTGNGSAENSSALAFSGSSQNLNSTEISAVFESPLIAGKNLVWCASFQMAWNALKTQVIGGDVLVEHASPVVDSLNASSLDATAIPEGTYFADAGIATEEFVATLDKEMQTAFPDGPVPGMQATGGIAAYAYLQVLLTFPHPYFKDPEDRLLFTASDGTETLLESFGVDSDDEDAQDVRRQVGILFYNRTGNGEREFAVNLTRNGGQYDVILAMISPRATLSDCYRYVTSASEAFPAESAAMLWDDTLLVPEIAWNIKHEFEELKGIGLLNEGFTDQAISRALQNIEFRLDREGVKLKSEAKIETESAAPMDEDLPRELVFNRPFLLCLKAKNADAPLFAMWVDNAELLIKK